MKKLISKKNHQGNCTLLLVVFLLTMLSCEMDEAPRLFPDPPVPLSIETNTAKSITTTSALCGGIIKSDGETPVLTKGVCWSTSPSPTIMDNVIEDVLDTNTIQVSLTDLMVYTRYYYRAFVTSDIDTLYGEETSFTTQGGTVTDIDGNVYHTISIGSQVWMLENLKVTRYRNGDSISLVTDNQSWAGTPGAYCYYNNDTKQGIVYGALYNFIAAVGQVAPEGWHVPTISEWKVLAQNNGVQKENGTTHWYSPNVGATNDNGFSALPGGSRDFVGTFDFLRERAYFWTSTPAVDFYGFAFGGNYIGLGSGAGYYWDEGIDRRYGFSVRCVKD